MKQINRWIGALGCAVIALGLVGVGGIAWAAEPAVAATATPGPSVQRGRQLFLMVGCVHCHGSAGQGSNAGARLAPDPLPAAAMAQILRSQATNMPGYSDHVLDDAAVADIAAWLASLPRPKGADEIPVLRALKGR